MFLLEVLIILAASRAICMASADPWSSWSTCTTTCGGGYRTRHQLCHPHNGTLPLCDTQRETCQTQHCPIPDLLSRENKRFLLSTSVDLHGSLFSFPAHWSKWSSCSATCGTGESTRHRICDTLTALIGKRTACTEHLERKTCSSGSCPIDGHWGSWSEWSKCPVTCGGHSQNRNRSCNNPVPSNGGRPCVGSNMESQNCSLSACPVDGHWGSWSHWSKCPVTCGGHSQNRHRSCNNPVPSNGGRPCVGSNMESHNCLLSACPVDGHWGSWSHWSKCPVTCGGHSQNRHRSCNNPVPSNGGRPCVGSNMESQNCSLSACPVEGMVHKLRFILNGHWGGWLELSNCPVTCFDLSQSKHRECNNPIPSKGGRQCVVSHNERQHCKLSVCRVDGNWSGWSEFSKCSVSCGLGTQIRSRSCSNPAPSNGGFDCLGLSAEALICSFPACVPEPRVCDKVRLLSSISHNNSFSQKGNTSCTAPSYHSSRMLLQELCNAPSTSLHISSQVIDVCNQALAFSPVVRKDDITGNTEYGILIECHGNQLKVASQDCTNNVHILDLNGTESDKYYVVDW